MARLPLPMIMAVEEVRQTMTNETEEVFTMGTCAECGGEGRVLLHNKCRTCFTNGCAEAVFPDTLALLNSFFATASDRLLGVLS